MGYEKFKHHCELGLHENMHTWHCIKLCCFDNVLEALSQALAMPFRSQACQHTERHTSQLYVSFFRLQLQTNLHCSLQVLLLHSVLGLLQAAVCKASVQLPRLHLGKAPPLQGLLQKSWLFGMQPWLAFTRGRRGRHLCLPASLSPKPSSK